MNGSQNIQTRVEGWYWYGRGQHQLRTALNRKLYRHVLQDSYLSETKNADRYRS